MTSPTLLLDGDIFIYQAALSAQTAADFGDGQWALAANLPQAVTRLTDEIDQIKHKLNSDKIIVALSDRQNFRKEIDPSYKANRKNVQRPLLLEPLRDHVKDHYRTFMRPTLEADDVLGILATSGKIIKGDKIIVSIDKDMRTIPCRFYNPNQMSEPQTISLQQADYAFAVQTLTGDPTDGYKGCPKMGVVKAANLLSGVAPCDYWPLIVEAYQKQDLDAAYALTQARLARILRVSDYNFKHKEPILWNPPPAAA